MVPSAFVTLAELPRTPGGKLDRRALPAPGRQRPEIAAPYAAPRRPLEERLAAMWAELFEIERVGIEDPFVELGGHSLLALQLASRVRDALGVELPLHNPFAVPTIAELARAIEERTAAGVSGSLALRPAPVPRGGEALPLTSSQERVWFLHRMAPESRAYQTQFTVRCRGALEVPALTGALAEIVRRHEIFRTTFPEAGGRPVQEIHPTGPSALPLADLSRLPEPVREAEARRLVSDGLQEPFDLERLPLVRWSLLRLGAEDHLLAVVEHHLVHDGWSNNLLLGEMVALYRAAMAGLPSPLPEPSLQLADYAVWQRRWLETDAAAEQLAYWQRTLAGCRPLELPADRPRPAAPSYRGGAPRFDLPAPLCRELRAVARRREATLFAAMLAAFQALLHRYTGDVDLCVGSGVANRSLRETEGLIGMIVNNAVLRTDLSGDPAFEELLGRAMAVAVGAYAHQDLPFDRVVEGVRPHRDRSVHPLFQVMLSFHDSAMPELDLPGVEATVEGLIANGSAKFNLNVIMIPRADQARSWQGGERPEWITVGWEYSADLFDPPTIERMTGHFRNLLAAAVADPGQRLSELSLLGEAERHQLLAEWRETEAFPGGARLDELFAHKAAGTPDAVAVICGHEALSYGELARRARALAADLRSLGVGPEVRVALFLDRSLEMVMAVVGVLAAGGAYVPLDPALPAGRLAWLLADAAPAVVVTRADLVDRLPEVRPAVVLVAETSPPVPLSHLPSTPRRERGNASGAAMTDLAKPPQPRSPSPGDWEGGRWERGPGGEDSAAYVIYTSGSTGTPKGVVVSHDNVVRLFEASQERFGFGTADVWTLFHSYAFDFSVWEIWGALLYGGRLVIVPELASRSPEELLRLLRDGRRHGPQPDAVGLPAARPGARAGGCGCSRRSPCAGSSSAARRSTRAPWRPGCGPRGGSVGPRQHVRHHRDHGPCHLAADRARRLDRRHWERRRPSSRRPGGAAPRPAGKAGAGRRAGRDPRWRRRALSRLPGPARADRRAVRAAPLVGRAWGAPLPLGRPGALAARHRPGAPGPHRPPGQGPRIPHRAGGSGGGARGAPRSRGERRGGAPRRSRRSPAHGLLWCRPATRPWSLRTFVPS